jgi:hypothetical protein
MKTGSLDQRPVSSNPCDLSNPEPDGLKAGFSGEFSDEPEPISGLASVRFLFFCL